MFYLRQARGAFGGREPPGPPAKSPLGTHIARRQILTRGSDSAAANAQIPREVQPFAWESKCRYRLRSNRSYHPAPYLPPPSP
eukprot:3576674-Pyramimonas_sp.AAC.1